MEFEKENFPKHIAIIMDGNRRWAKAKGKPASFGHKEGAKTLEKIVRYANKIGLKYITVFAFSTENWKRSEEEVKGLMTLLQMYLDDYTKRADSENVKVNVIGDLSALSQGMQKSIQKCMERTKDNTGVHFNIAINYGGKDEIVKAMKKIAQEVKENQITPEEIDEKMIEVNKQSLAQLHDINYTSILLNQIQDFEENDKKQNQYIHDLETDNKNKQKYIENLEEDNRNKQKYIEELEEKKEKRKFF